MWVEILRWFSIVACWIAAGLNIYSIIQLRRTKKAYDEARECLRELYLKVKEKYNESKCEDC